MKMVMKMKNVAQDGVGNERKHFRPQMRHRRSHPQNKNGPFASIPPVQRRRLPFLWKMTMWVIKVMHFDFFDIFDKLIEAF